MFDLHFHSLASDGEASLDVVSAAVAAHPELACVALTDHDAIADSVELSARDERAWVGAELTSYTGKRRIDLLALGVRPDDAALNDYLRARVAERRARFALFGELLRERGWTFEPEATALARPQLAIPHVVEELRRQTANAGRLAELGIAEPPEHDTNDQIYPLVLDPLGPIIRERSESAVADGPAMVAMIHAAGGLAIIAHPWISPYDQGKQTRTKARRLLAPLLAAGVDGLERWHPRQLEPAVQDELAALAAEHSLLETIGSDDHSADLVYLGTVGPAEDDVAMAELERIESAWRKRQNIKTHRAA